MSDSKKPLQKIDRKTLASVTGGAGPVIHKATTTPPATPMTI
jgi:hypothetical protein